MIEVLYKRKKTEVLMLVRGKIVKELKTILCVLSSGEIYYIPKRFIVRRNRTCKWIYLN